MSSTTENPRSVFLIMKFAALVAAALLIGLIYLNSNLNPSRQDILLQIPDLSRVELTALPQGALAMGDLNSEWTTSSGLQISAHNFPGRLMLLSFWAHWCWPCLVELPQLNQLHQELSGRGLFILAINLDEDPLQQKQAQEFWEEKQLTMESLRLSPSELQNIFPLPVSSLPFHALVGPQGHILWSQQGALDWSHPQVVNRLTALLTKIETF